MSTYSEEPVKRRMAFQQDNDLKHTSRAKNFLRDNMPKVID